MAKSRGSDVNKIIRRVYDTGKVIIGQRRAIKALKAKDVKMIIMAANCPGKTQEDVLRYIGGSGIPLYVFSGTSLDLGSICGNPYPISVMGILDSGTSKILSLGEGQ